MSSRAKRRRQAGESATNPRTTVGPTGEVSVARQKYTESQIASDKPILGSYRGRPFEHWLAQYGERPIFSAFAIVRMLYDNKIRQCLSVRDGLLSMMEVDVIGAQPTIQRFVEETWNRIWNNHNNDILKAKEYGWAPFEVMYKRGERQWRGKVLFDCLKDFHPIDCRPLVQRSKIVGMTVRCDGSDLTLYERLRENLSIGESVGKAFLWRPKTLWITWDKRHGDWFGNSILEAAYIPWYEKETQGGGRKLRQLRMIKDAWVGDVLYAPATTIETPLGPRWGLDIAREAVENRQAGGALILPSLTDGEGNKLFEYQPPSNVSGATPIIEYIAELDKEIAEALLTPNEVLEAAETGSGYSGRQIPFDTLLASLQCEGGKIVSQIKDQIIDPLVRINFGVEPEFDIQPKDLIDTVTRKMGGGDGGEQGAAGGSFGGGPSGGMDAMRMAMMGAGPEGGGKGQGQGAERPPRGGKPPSGGGGGAGVRFSQAMAEAWGEAGLPANCSGLESPGCTVGGVFFSQGEWISGEELQWASEGEILALAQRQKHNEETQWVTVGGRPGPDGQRHVGGQAIPVSKLEGRRVGSDSKDGDGKGKQESPPSESETPTSAIGVDRKLSDGRSLQIHTDFSRDEPLHDVFIDGKRTVQSGRVGKLENAITKDGVTYAHRVGNTALTDEDVRALESSYEEGRKQFLSSPAGLPHRRESLVLDRVDALDRLSVARERMFQKDTGAGAEQVRQAEDALRQIEEALAEFDRLHPEIVADIAKQRKERTEKFLEGD